jgi:hypothetical protein
MGRIAATPDPSWPGLTRPSKRQAAKRVYFRVNLRLRSLDGRVKPGHDEGDG